MHLAAPQTSLASDPARGARDETRDIILDAARSLLRERLYCDFAMDALARRCGLSRQSVYTYFPHRDAVYRASRTSLLAGFREALPLRVPNAAGRAAGLEIFIGEVLAAFARSDHAELSRSAELDAPFCPWIAELYDAQVIRPLAGAILAFLPTIGMPACPAAAAELVAMLRAAARPGAPAPSLAASELARLFVARYHAARPQLARTA